MHRAVWFQNTIKLSHWCNIYIHANKRIKIHSQKSPTFARFLFEMKHYTIINVSINSPERGKKNSSEMQSEPAAHRKVNLAKRLLNFIANPLGHFSVALTQKRQYFKTRKN